MRIITGTDYYDGGMAYGHDDHTVFVREKNRNLPCGKFGLSNRQINMKISTLDEKVMPFSRSNAYFQSSYNSIQKGKICLYEVSLILCGIQYFGMLVQHMPDGTTTDWFEKSNHYFWSEDSFKAEMQRHGYEVKTPKRMARWMTSGVSVEEYFIPAPVSQKVLDYLIENNIALVTSSQEEREMCRINGDNLKDYEFFKVMDAYTAFQEIDMFIGGVLSNAGKPMVEISDKDRIAKHGFDKMSFRKEKEVLPKKK